MTSSNTGSAGKAYVLGHTDAELHRLALQGDFLRPMTMRLLLSAGIEAGMKVLEIGCGVGDVCLLAAELVGPEGRVVGVDRSPDAVRFAIERAGAAQLRNVSFIEGDDGVAVPSGPFDAIVGRYVLVHQPDPVAFVRAAVDHLRPAGIAAFHEVDLAPVPPCRPPNLVYDAFSARYDELRAKVPTNAAAQLAAVMTEAGLTVRGGFCERSLGLEGSDLFFKWRAATCAALEGPGHPSSEPAAVEKVAAELQAAVAAVHGQALGPDQWCIWAQR